MSGGILAQADRLAPAGRVAVDALVTDRYLDGLLAAGDRRAADAPADAAFDPALRDASLVLRRLLVRVHPSFRFEERLAARLADLAAIQSGPALAATGRGATLLPLPSRSWLDGSDRQLEGILRGDLDPAGPAADFTDARPGSRRPLLVGGAITTAALSLAGVAWVAWRAARTSARTAPASADRGPAGAGRPAVASGTGGGLGGPA